MLYYDCISQLWQDLQVLQWQVLQSVYLSDVMTHYFMYEYIDIEKF